MSPQAESSAADFFTGQRHSRHFAVGFASPDRGEDMQDEAAVDDRRIGGALDAPTERSCVGGK
jgi:hypothetical protein